MSKAVRKQAAKDKAEGKQKDPKDLTIWDALGVHCSANERRADEASRDVENWLKCYYMKDRLGEEFTGVISGVTPFGIFVQLDQLFVEGLVHVTGLGTDYFQYDDARHELRGERTGQVYQLTGRVTVQVARVDLESRKIDLVLAQAKDAVPAPLERARAAALDAMEPKPPRRRKAKGGADGAVPVSAQEARVTPAEPAASTLGATDESDEDVVFVPPTRSRRGRSRSASAASAASAANQTASKKTAAKKSAPTRNASKTRKKK
jgi:ribonuclease R